MPELQQSEQWPSFSQVVAPPWLKAAVEFLELVPTVMQTHVHATVDEINGRTRFNGAPGAEARAKVGTLIGVQLPRLMHEALLQAPSEATRHYIHLRLQRLLDMACEIARVMDDVPARGSYVVQNSFLDHGSTCTHACTKLHFRNLRRFSSRTRSGTHRDKIPVTS